MRVGVLGGEARDLINFRGHLISEMAKAGHEVFAIAPGGTEPIRSRLRELGAEYLPVKMDRTGMNPLADTVALFRLWRLFRRLDLDALLSYEVKAVIYGTKAAALAGVSDRFAMITGRGTTLQGEVRGLREWIVRTAVKCLFRHVLARARGVLFQNRDDLQFFREEGLYSEQGAWRIINGSGVDLDHFGCAPLPDGATTFLFVGRLLWDKGVHEFVEAARLLAESGISAKFQILGPLDSNPKGIKAHHLDSWTRDGVVEYLGEAQDVRPFLAAAHVLVLPSYGEGVPRSVLEALAMGRAVVTTTAPGCKETVEHGRNGFLVPVGDRPSLAGAMKVLASDPGLVRRFGSEGRILAETRFDVRKVTAEIMGFMGLA